jgi:hypothetical protein
VVAALPPVADRGAARGGRRLERVAAHRTSRRHGDPSSMGPARRPWMRRRPGAAFVGGTVRWVPRHVQVRTVT